MLTKNKCKICRRLGTKLFLKGEKCLSQKCPMIKKAYPPGFQGKRRGRSASGFSRQLKEKQKLKNFYNLSEHQFKKYVRQVLEKRGKVEDAQTFLIQELENRLDNVIFRLGFAESRAQARQLVSHNHFQVNGKNVNIPSYQIKKGDKITIRNPKKQIFSKLISRFKEQETAVWLKLDSKKLEGQVIDKPNLEQAAPPAEISTIFEYYSR